MKLSLDLIPNNVVNQSWIEQGTSAYTNQCHLRRHHYRLISIRRSLFLLRHVFDIHPPQPKFSPRVDDRQNTHSHEENLHETIKSRGSDRRKAEFRIDNGEAETTVIWGSKRRIKVSTNLGIDDFA